MFGRLINGIFSILILLISNRASIHSSACSPGEITCSRGSSTWCCLRLIHLCGNNVGVCEMNTMPPRPPTFFTLPPNFFTPPNIYTQRPYPTSSPSNFGSGLIAVIIMVPIVILTICLTVYIRSQRQQRSRATIATTNNRRVVGQYRQQLTRGSVPIVHVDASYNAGTVSLPLSNIHEALPPSYEAATTNLPPKYQAEPPPYSPPITATTDLTDSHV